MQMILIYVNDEGKAAHTELSDAGKNYVKQGGGDSILWTEWSEPGTVDEILAQVRTKLTTTPQQAQAPTPTERQRSIR